MSRELVDQLRQIAAGNDGDSWGPWEDVRIILLRAADAIAPSEKTRIDCGAPGGCDHPKCDCFTPSAREQRSGWCITRTLYWRGVTKPDEKLPYRGLWSEYSVSCLRLATKTSAEEHAKQQEVPEPYRIEEWRDK